MNERISTILRFWFGDSTPEAHDRAAVGRWFKKDPSFDEAIRASFGGDVERAARGELDGWAGAAPPEGARGALALVVLLDQFSRNLFRDSPRAFAQDERALRIVVVEGRARGLESAMTLLERYVFAMPLMHAEDRATQRDCVSTFEALAAEAKGAPLEGLLTSGLDYARRHAAIVERFGRYPHRNALLGRPSTDEETAFLREPGSSF